MNSSTYLSAATFMQRNARPLDYARWQFHFEDGSVEQLLHTLSYYQNEDGGFGHALEPDCHNPFSSPIQTWAATEIINEIGFRDKTHPIIVSILSYLSSKEHFRDDCWLSSIPSNNEYPHAPWWEYDNDSTSNNRYNPTVALVGFIIRFADANSNLYHLACRLAKDLYTSYEAMFSDLQAPKKPEMHTVVCFVKLLDYLKQTEAKDIIDTSSLEQLLRLQIKQCIPSDRNEWETKYICKPSWYLRSKNSVFYEDNKAMADYEMEYIVKSQLTDGSWSIPWSWNDYADSWELSKIWWKAHGIIMNMLYLKGME
ncbi:MAG: hypothetical protein FWG21_04215 [Oscillospiraceae bacterium]|nr:hypothetical protein [Oscillospiraceae bacterium]